MFTAKRIATAGMIAALYSALTLIFLPISFGPVQCRISEMLTILPAFMPSAVMGLTLGCLISNILGGAIFPDIVFGTLATLIGALGTYCLAHSRAKAVRMGKARDGIRFRLLAILPPIVSNTLIVPLVLKYAYVYDDALIFMAFTVFIGEVLSVGVLGNIFMSVLLRLHLLDKIDAS